MSTLLQDLRYGIRMLGKSPGITFVAVTALALGIGANSVIFSSVNSMLVRPFPFKDLDRIVALWETAPKQEEDRISSAPANFLDWEKESKGFDLLAAGHHWDVNLTGAGVAERVEGYQVTANFFPLLGMAPELGRSIVAPDFEPGRTSVVVLSHGFWARHLGADAAIIGKGLHLNGQQFTVIGVMPADFDFPVGAEAWAPLDLRTSGLADRADHYLKVIGRLKPGISVPQAQAELDTISTRLAQQYPQTNSGHGVRVVRVVEDLTTGSRQFVLVLMGAAVFVLLLACANVANLQLARAATRQKEIALRVALGGSRWRIVRQLLVESVVMALAGGLAGLLLASWGLDVSGRSIPPFIVQHIAGLKHMQVDSRVLAFTFFVAFLTGIITGFARAWHVSRPDLSETLKQGGRGVGSSLSQKRLRGLLVVTEVALALVLLVGAGLMVRGFRDLLNQKLGFDRTQVLTFRIALSEAQYGKKERVRGFYHQVVEKLQSLPGVEAVACITSLPSSWSWERAEYNAEGQPPATPGELRLTVTQSITPDLFRTLRVPLLKGRVFTAQDGPETAPVAIVSESMARRVWPGQDPVGKRLKLGPAEGAEPWRTIVGMVGDVKQSPFDRDVHPATYLPFDQMPEAPSSLAVRTFGDPHGVAAAARAQVRAVDPEQPPYDMRTLEQLVSDDVSGVDFSARMMLAFGLIALVLSASGIFALMAYSVMQRTHEIGVRRALGAQRIDMLQLVLSYALKLTVMGLAVGIPCALGLTRALSSLLFGVLQMDPVIFAAATLSLALVAALAAYIPARWATKVDPMVALRYE